MISMMKAMIDTMCNSQALEKAGEKRFARVGPLMLSVGFFVRLPV